MGLTHPVQVMEVEAAVGELDIFRVLRGTEDAMKKLSLNRIRQKIAEAKLTEKVGPHLFQQLKEKKAINNEGELGLARLKVAQLKMQLEFWNGEVERLDTEAATKIKLQGERVIKTREMNLVALDEQGDESSDVASSEASSAASSAGTIEADGGGTLQEGKMDEKTEDTTEAQIAASVSGVTRRHKK